MLRSVLLALTVACLAAGTAAAKPPLEAFGDVPEIRAMELSPDGSKIAYLRRAEGVDYLMIHELAGDKLTALAKVTQIKARDIYFVGNDYIVLVASKDTRTYWAAGRYEWSAAFAFNLKTGTYAQLLRDTEDLYPSQTGLGRIVAADPAKAQVYMPAFMGRGYEGPSHDLVRVPLEHGRGLRPGSTKGTKATIDWLALPSGEPVAREDFDEIKQVHEIRKRTAEGGWQTIYSKETRLPQISLEGRSRDGKSLFVTDARESDFQSLYSMSLEDGTISGPLAQRDDAEVAETVTDIDRVVYGVRFSGMFPSYEMFDPEVNAEMAGAKAALGAFAVYLDSWSADWSKLLLYVNGGSHAERYILFDRRTRAFTNAGNARPSITQADVGEVIGIEYRSRDGLKIPGVITWPTGVAADQRKNLPLVVLPHGGPQSHDSVGFDWLAQFLANEGYLVLQPNFRGSTGFGNDFRAAGYGEWGRKMQDDITDGVNALTRMGWADPERACIVGWSYGGYAALEGGQRTPDLYKCIASIAGVSNLDEMLTSERRKYGPDSRVYTYWKLLIGDPDTEQEAIDAVSPALHAEDFKAPVLLIHGASDTVVPVSQSDRMNDALQRLRKPVTYVRIPGDDHSLVDNESRRQALTALGEFLKTHIGQ